jgi:hypothetical protein
MNRDKPVHAANAPTPTHRPRRSISHEQIAERAEKLWRERGQPAGQDEAIWLEAESQLQAEAEARPVAGTEARAPVGQPAEPIVHQTKSRDSSDTIVPPRASPNAPPKRTAGKLRSQ